MTFRRGGQAPKVLRPVEHARLFFIFYIISAEIGAGGKDEKLDIYTVLAVYVWARVGKRKM